MIRLVLPRVQYEKSYRTAVRERMAEPRQVENWAKSSHREMREGDRFADFTKRLRGYRRGKNLPKGFVPESVFWFVDGSEYIGMVTIRHNLTEHLKKIGGHVGYWVRPSKRKQGYGKKIFELALKEAHALGIKRVLVTCDEDNVASCKIIKTNGGVLEDIVKQGTKMPRKMRFWISL